MLNLKCKTETRPRTNHFSSQNNPALVGRWVGKYSIFLAGDTGVVVSRTVNRHLAPASGCYVTESEAAQLQNSVSCRRAQSQESPRSGVTHSMVVPCSPSKIGWPGDLGLERGKGGINPIDVEFLRRMFDRMCCTKYNPGRKAEAYTMGLYSKGPLLLNMDVCKWLGGAQPTGGKCSLSDQQGWI